ncbi:MAG: hypothetical protein ABI222_12970, partial [Opitutaceae bacterium]
IQPDASVSGLWGPSSKPVGASLDPAPVKLTQARFGVSGVWLRFFTASPWLKANANVPLSPTAVSYQIIRRAATPSDPVPHYMLYRAEVSPQDTFAAGYDLSSANYAADALARPGLTEVIADQVIDFGIWFYYPVRDPEDGPPGLRRVFPMDSADLEYRASADVAVERGGRPMPAVAEVFMRVLTPEGARLMTALEAGQNSGDWWTMAVAHSRVFTRRIQLKAASS